MKEEYYTLITVNNEGLVEEYGESSKQSITIIEVGSDGSVKNKL